MAGRRWTANEDRALRTLMKGRFGYREIAASLRRGVNACRQQAYKLGLTPPKGSPAWKARIARANKGRRFNPATEFKKGNVPWSKGRKGIHLSPATEFKKGSMHGQARRRYRLVGKVTYRKDKTGAVRRWIKVRDDGPPQHRYVPFARYLYGRHCGPVPPGHFVVHRDGDTLNDDMPNLLLMHRRGLIAWQDSVRPKMEPRRKAAVAKSQRLRWAIYRARKAARDATDALRATA